MIKSNELRLGNYYDQFGNIHQATWVTIKELSQAPEGQLWCKPIPLTEDWLKRFGFIEYFSPCDLRIVIQDGVLLQFYFSTHNIECWIGDDIARTDIKYVHQLQNLYFALTQTELTPSDGGKIE